MNIKKNLPLIAVCVILMLLLCAVCSCSILEGMNEAASNEITAASKGPGDDYGTGGPRPVIETVTEASGDGDNEYFTRIEVLTGEWGEFVTDENGEIVTEVYTYEPETVIEIVTTPSGEPATDENGEVETRIIIVEPETTPQQQYISDLQNVNHFAEGIEYKYLPENAVAAITQLTNQSTVKTEFPIGGWMTPVSALRSEMCGKTGALFAAIKRLDWAGFNFVITQDEWSSAEWLMEVCDAAKRAGIKVWYNSGNQDPEYTLARINAIQDSEYADVLTSVIVSTSPAESDLAVLAETSKVIRRELGEDSALKVFSILPPPYASNAGYTSTYANYLKTYALDCKPHAFMYDYSPCQGTAAMPIAEIVSTLLSARAQAMSTGAPLYGVVQCSGSDTLREPSLYEMRLNAHLDLALGADGLVYSMACQQEYGSTTAMLDMHGMTTDAYDKVTAVTKEITAMRGRCIDFVCDGAIVMNAPEIREAMHAVGQQAERESYRHLTSVTEKDGKAVIVGLFRPSANGVGEGYYVVNPDTENCITVTLTMDIGQMLAVWSGKGCEIANWFDSLTLTLGPGEGIFVENGGANIN